MKAYQLKITIKDSHPPIWRRIIVPAGLSFSQLTLVLNTSMGWCGYHLSSYTFGQLMVRLDDDYDVDDGWGFSEYEVLDSANYIIDEFFEQVKSFTYVYDFGDDWRHQVQIENVIYDYDKKYPQVIKYKGETQYEDCGGIWGYYELLETLKNPDSPEYDEMKEWTEGHFSLEYDIDFVNRELRKMELTKKNAKPMSRSELYEDYFAGKTKFKTIVPPEDRDGDRFMDAEDMGLPGGDIFGSDRLFNPMNVLVDIICAEMIEKLTKNTELSEKEIMDALELTPNDRERLRFVKAHTEY